MTRTPEPMKLEWIKSSGKEDIYGIYIDRDGAKYPLAIIEFAPALGRDDLERLFRAAPEKLEACKALLEACKALLNAFEGYEMLAALDATVQEQARAAIAKVEQSR